MEIAQACEYERCGNQLADLSARLLAIRCEMLQLEQQCVDKTNAVHDAQRHSASNLLHYLALRRHDMRALQDQLAAYGLSSLGRAESHVLASFDAVLNVLASLAGKPFTGSERTVTKFAIGKSTLDKNTTALLGPKPDARSVRIMVTMPTEAASKPSLVRDLLAAGMDCMRVNCAHDDEAAWAGMIENLRRAERDLGKRCAVLMDLPGPKLRTGPTEAAPQVVKLSPRRDRFGKVIETAKIWLTAIEEPQPPGEDCQATFTVPGDWLANLSLGDRIEFFDASEQARSVEISKVAGANRWAESAQTAYITSDTVFHLTTVRSLATAAKESARVGNLPCVAQPILLKSGDQLILSDSCGTGRSASLDEQGIILQPATMGVTLPEIFADLRPGEKIWFDDGKIGGVIRTSDVHGAVVEITKARVKGEKLRGDKGINVPDSELRLPALTADDIARLPFIARHADLVGYSFVRRPSDIHLLQSELAKVGGGGLGIVLKIETRKAFERLPELILAAMRSERIGVMIARGDLAVECGYERTGELQEEIMWIAEAAHVPVIWATQVLENLAKKGRVSRAEITDAAMAERAECVMLNKGPYMVETVNSLDDVLRRMQFHQDKKSSLLRPLTIAINFRRQQLS
jgi:pyruvate kinase